VNLRRSSRQNSSVLDRAQKYLPPAPYRNLIFLITTVLLLASYHLGSTPWERALGLAHGTRITAPNTQFLVFDHLTQTGTEQLNRNLLHHTGGTSEIVVVSGYGLWRFGLLAALAYAMMLLLSRWLVNLNLRTFLSPGIGINRTCQIPYCILLGVGLAMVGVGHVFPALFALIFFRTLVLANKSRPDIRKVGRSIELLDMTRGLWLGWLILPMLSRFAVWSPQIKWSMLGLVIGGLASYLFLLGLNYWPGKLFEDEKMMETSRVAFYFGCWETIGIFALCVAGFLVNAGNVCGTILLFGAFGYGRLAQTVLLRSIARMDRCGENSRTESTYRIAAGVWFLLPLVVGEFFAGFDQMALMLWLTGLVPLVSAGRPWGSTVREDEIQELEVRERPVSRPFVTDYGALTPRQKAAVLFMSLPPEDSAQLFSELGPEEVQAITLEITQLPSVSPECRAKVCNEFLTKDAGHRGTANQSKSEPVGRTLGFKQGRRKPKAPTPQKSQKPAASSPRRRKRRKQHVCDQCGEAFNHGIGIRKHQRATGHKGIEVWELRE